MPSCASDKKGQNPLAMPRLRPTAVLFVAVSLLSVAVSDAVSDNREFVVIDSDSTGCLDGSPYAFWVWPGSGSDWSLFIQGGGWCLDEGLCETRASISARGRRAVARPAAARSEVRCFARLCYFGSVGAACRGPSVCYVVLAVKPLCRVERMPSGSGCARDRSVLSRFVAGRRRVRSVGASAGCRTRARRAVRLPIAASNLIDCYAGFVDNSLFDLEQPVWACAVGQRY